MTVMASISDAGRDEIGQRADQLLDELGLSDRSDNLPEELSGGERQRVAIGRALVTDPEMILADEPTGNLDSRSGLDVLAIFKRLHRQGRTIILVTHDEEVAEHADRVVVLRDGTIAEDRPVVQPRDAEKEKPHSDQEETTA